MNNKTKSKGEVSELVQSLQNAREEEKILSEKQYEVQKNRIEKDHEKVLKSRELQKSFEVIEGQNCLSIKRDDLSLDMRNEISAKINPYPLIFDCFEKKVEVWERQLMLGFSATGGGKSTFVSNVAFNIISNTDRGVVVISNEERAVDILGRIACLFTGLNFNNRNRFTENQKKAYQEACESFIDRLVIVDDKFSGKSGCTTTPEGLEKSIEYLEDVGALSDCAIIIIDYYQNISYTNSSSGNHYEALFRVASYLSNKKNYLPCGILLMAQIKPAAGTGKSRYTKILDFKARMIQAKKIADESTFIFEIIPDRKNKLTTFIVHKNRFGGFYGPTFLKWENGLMRKLTIEEELKREK
jgi:hypothetical protein